MLNAKYTKILFGLTAAAVISLGGATAFAATSELSLTPVRNVDVSKIEAQKGDPGELKIAGKIDPRILESMKNATTAPAKDFKK